MKLADLLFILFLCLCFCRITQKVMNRKKQVVLIKSKSSFNFGDVPDSGGILTFDLPKVKAKGL